MKKRVCLLFLYPIVVYPSCFVTQEIPVEFPLSIAGHNSPNDVRLMDDEKTYTEQDFIFSKRLSLEEIATIRTQKDFNKQCARIIKLCLYINERVSFTEVWSDSAVYEHFYPPKGDAFSYLEKIDIRVKSEQMFKPIGDTFCAGKDHIRILWACSLLEKLMIVTNDATIKPKCFYIAVMRLVGSFLCELGCEVNVLSPEDIQRYSDYAPYLTVLVDRINTLLSVVEQETLRKTEHQMYWGYFYYFGTHFLRYEKTFVNKFNILQNYSGFRAIDRTFNIGDTCRTYAYLRMYWHVIRRE